MAGPDNLFATPSRFALGAEHFAVFVKFFSAHNGQADIADGGQIFGIARIRWRCPLFGSTVPTMPSSNVLSGTPSDARISCRVAGGSDDLGQRRDEIVDRGDAARCARIPVAMESPRRLRNGDHMVVEHPVQLKMLGMSGGHARHADHPSQQHAEKVRAAHVRMQHLDAAAANFRRDAAQLVGRKTPHIGKQHVHRVVRQKVGDPRAGRAKQRHLVSPAGELAAQQGAMAHGPVDLRDRRRSP